MSPVKTVSRGAKSVTRAAAHRTPVVNRFVPQGTQSYEDTLRTLSEASVNQFFEPYRDIAWDAPEMAVLPDDDRWILTDKDVLGAHGWYKSLPREEQVRVGMYRMALVAKVGLQFEQLLIAGVMNYLVWSRNNNPRVSLRHPRDSG